ncbi:helix-turn-helix domain-containing protein [Salsipaludibacter albus]|uniref:helix-turn-helix domain-containing protein n=1 Tax=Salsipaludibacter albus TaxID=2849650 RepID=UPI001EE4068F|nr:helix-turn-helix domain-containing protein [Salsipaludibacter albus]MBY5161459.1 helix-turn-helix domain-containing protein [Salsipaludibacter albus]
MTLTQLPPTLSVEEASELLGISLRSAYKAAQTGELPTLRLGRRLLVPTPKLLRMLGVDAEVDTIQHADPAS